jgi:hypothetical protein
MKPTFVATRGADPLVRGRRPRRPAGDIGGSEGTRADQGVRPTQ